MEKLKSFFTCFFGKGEEIEFNNFTFAHLAPILVAIGVILIIAKYGSKIRASKLDKTFRYILAFWLIITEMSYFWRMVGLADLLEPNALEHLPITVCGWAIIFCSYMVIGKSQTLFDISYFWLFSGSIFALVTPTVISYTGPTRYRYYQFWFEHLLGFVAIFYMVFVHKMRPTVKSALKSYAAFAVMAVIAYFTNRILGPGANYLFMAELEDTKSILDLLPQNFALKILLMASVVTLLYFIAYLPWLIIDIRAKKFHHVNNEKGELCFEK